MKNKKLAVYVLTVSKHFLKGHSKTGQDTGFAPMILSGKKPQTMRGNYAYWKKIADNINAGRGVLSIRQWTGQPYNSKQTELMQLDKLGVQKVDVKIIGSICSIRVDGVAQTHTQERLIIKNDGLSYPDFLEWFKDSLEGGAILHFTSMRY